MEKTEIEETIRFANIMFKGLLTPENAKLTAKYCKELKDALIKEGFTLEDSIQIIKGALGSSAKK